MKYLVEIEHQRCPDVYYKGDLFMLKDGARYNPWNSPIELMIRAMFPWGIKAKIEAITWK